MKKILMIVVLMSLYFTSSLDAESPEGKYLKSMIDKARVRAGQWHPGKRLDECQQYMVRAGKRLELSKQAVVAAVAEQERLQGEYNVGSARLEELKKEATAIPPPMEVDSSSERIQQLEAMVAELRRERGRFATTRRCVEASWRDHRRPDRLGSQGVGRVATVDHFHVCKVVIGHGAGRSRPRCRTVS